MNANAQIRYDRLVEIERQANRAFAAVSQLCDEQMRRDIASAQYLLAEVRQAGRFLVDPVGSEGVLESVINRLVLAIQEVN